jgi:hypothetical protein
MAKTKPAAEAPAKPPGDKPRQQDSVRETFESIVVAFVLAFLFRTFIAEAFVIPTGSMAPTLFGRHKDVHCPQCRFEYEVSASYELNDETNQLVRRIDTATCPNCQFTANIRDLPVFKGDRILVNKFPYELGEPQRWDVCVFKYPENPTATGRRLRPAERRSDLQDPAEGRPEQAGGHPDHGCRRSPSPPTVVGPGLAGALGRHAARRRTGDHRRVDRSSRRRKDGPPGPHLPVDRGC